MPPQGPPQSQHLRRESSQSVHSDMSSAGMNNVRGGGFQPNGGRGGRGAFGPGYGHPAGQSPSPAYRSLSGRGPQNMSVPPYAGQGQMGGAHSNSPFRPTPRTPQMTAAAMQSQMHYNQQMQHGPYPGYPPHPMQQPVNLPFHSLSLPNGMLNTAVFSGSVNSKCSSPVEQFLLSSNCALRFPFLYLVDPSVADHFLTNVTLKQGMYAYNPEYAAYYGVPVNIPYQPPSSPRPNQFNPQPVANPQYIPPGYGGQAANHAPNMSRNSSQMSERPPSNLANPQTPSLSAANHVSVTPSQTSASPAPSSTFQVPTRPKSKAIVIKDPTGNVIDFNKPKPSSPAPPAPAPSAGPVVASTPTPPPRAPSTSIPQHTRTESNVKSAAEKREEFQALVQKQLKSGGEDQERKKEEEERAAKEKAEAEAKAAKEKEEAEAKAAQEKAEAEKAEKAREEEERLKKEAEEKKRLEDEETERMIAEMEAQEREEEERERQFQIKKQAEAEEKKKKEAEAAAKADEELKRLEKEAEERELAKERGESADTADEEAKALFASLKKPTFGPGAEATPGESGTSTPNSEVSMPPPPQPLQPRITSAGKPKPAALKLETNKPVEPAQPTAGMQSLKSARFLQVRDDIAYPAGFKSPNPALNMSSKGRGRQYDKDFLLQFQDVFKEKPSVDWDMRLRETVGDSADSARPQSARTPSVMSGRQPSRTNIGVGMGGPMGAFMGSSGGRTLPPNTTSEQRFAMSAGQGNRPPTMTNPLAQFANRTGGFSMGTPQPMIRTNSYQNMPQPNSPRTGSTRGKGSRRGDNRAPSKREEEQAAKAMPLTAGQELKPLEVSNSGWKPSSLGKAPQQPTAPGSHMAPDMVQRKVKAALNKMTPDNFERISGQILLISAQSKDETDGRTLRQVIQLTFEKACDEAHWSEMYARFCKSMLESMSPEIKDDNVRDKHGNLVVGGALFRKYLLNRCQEDFERGWEINLPEKPEGQEAEAVMLSDEYYVAAAAKRRGLGLIQFIGELYKLNMLTLRIMHECVMRLINFEGLPDEAAIESLSKLLRTIGRTMEASDQGPGLLNQYFQRIDIILNMEGLASRMKFMLMDIIDLRKNKWEDKKGLKGPKTIQEIHAEAAAAQAAQEAERLRANKQAGGRPQLGRGDARSASGGMMPPADFNKSQVGIDDLRKLAKGASSRTASQGPASFGPSSLFAGRSSSGRRGPGASLMRGGEDSATSSRTGTPPTKDKETAPQHTNSFR
jgi:translation initiation factor 4G